MSSKRWFVVRSIKLNSGSIPADRYLTKAEADAIPFDRFRPLVRGVLLFDITGEIDIPWRERNKLKLRHRAFSELGSAEAKKLHDLSIEMMAQGRSVEFKSPREKVLAEEIKQEKILEKKAEIADKPRRRRVKPKPEMVEPTPVENLDLPDL